MEISSEYFISAGLLITRSFERLEVGPWLNNNWGLARIH